MGMPEPSNELWAAVKAISDPWPPDDEDQVRQIGAGWRQAGQAAASAGSQVGSAGQATTGAWGDQGGAAAATGLNQGAQRLQGQQQGAEQQAAMADQYAQALTNVKHQITDFINANLPQYMQLKNPIFGAQGAAQLQAFVQQIAQRCQAIVQGAVGGLHAPPPAPPAGDSTLKNVGDWADIAAGVLGVAALIPTPLSPLFAGGAALAAGVGLTAHGVDAFKDGEITGSEAGTLVGDGLGAIPGGRALGAAAKFGDAAHGWGTLERSLNGAAMGGGAGLGAGAELSDNSGVDDASTAGGIGNDGRLIWNTVSPMMK